MRQIKLRAAMVTIAVLALLLAVGVGFRRRAHRLDRLALQFSREASRLEHLLVESSLSLREAEAIIDQVHRNDAIANRFRIAAARPWLPTDPSPAQ